ncbi:HutD family protein [Saxibacter everestensis]|uniref:HutD family protein n=1 Tax=Saxibacter everestensis TaxID=2909229 RepID=A0ABY8QQZ7_9MICO|nr:HutD family protein [Brevibacteriaceae bacterium ZFBP1038]
MLITTHYGSANYAAMPWKNGGGTTIELARDTADGDYAWRISIADITVEGPFSTFPGMARIISVLEGGGMRLISDGQSSGDLLPSQSHAFDGGSSTTCTLLDGPIRDFNLIYRRDRFAARMEWIGFPAARTFLSSADTMLVYCHGPETLVRVAAGQEILLARDDLLRIENPGGPAQLSIRAANEGPENEGRCAVVELCSL